MDFLKTYELFEKTLKKGNEKTMWKLKWSDEVFLGPKITAVFTI